MEGGYSNKVDVWAMGCIFHELVTGKRPFLGAQEVQEYQKSKSPVILHCDSHFNEYQCSIFTVLTQDMLHLSPNLRPSASQLFQKFDGLHALAIETVSRLTDATTMTKPSPVLESKTLFHIPTHALATKAPPDWIVPKKLSTWAVIKEKVVLCETFSKEWNDYETIIEAIVNQPNTRFVTTSFDDETYSISVKLWSGSGDLMWATAEGRLVSSVKDHISPAFSEDGKYLGVYIDSSVQIIECGWGKHNNLISLKSAPQSSAATGSDVKAISIFRNGSSIAVCVPGNEVEGDNAILKKVRFLQENARSKNVDVVNFSGISSVGLSYIAGGNRLLLVGKSDQPPIQGFMVGFCWDMETRSEIQKFRFGEARVNALNATLSTPLCIVKDANEPRLVVCVSYSQGTLLSGLYQIDSAGSLGCSHGGRREVHGVVPGGLLIINWEAELKFWNLNSYEPMTVATLESDDSPSLLDIKGLVVTDDRITLITKYGLTSFIKQK